MMGCDRDQENTSAPDTIIEGLVVDTAGIPLADVHLHLIYLFDTSSGMNRPISPTNVKYQSPTGRDADSDYDLGDLEEPYPTYGVAGGGPAHRLTGIVWLGTGVTTESAPNTPNLDMLDDGVRLLEFIPSDSCPTVLLQTQVSAGPNYINRPLYLNLWIDGNQDGDFDDENLCGIGVGSEWWIVNRDIDPGIYLDTLLMPAVDMTISDRRAIRVRLSGEALGRSGYTGVDETLGEVEDYWLGLEQESSAELVAFWGEAGNLSDRLYWTTATETGNQFVFIYRAVNYQGPYGRIGSVPGHGTTLDSSHYSYFDCGVFNEIPYYYRLAAVNNGNVEVELEPIITLTPSETYPTNAPGVFKPIYPNPAESEVRIPFELECSRQVTVVVESADYESVDTLWRNIPPETEFEIAWDGGNHPNGLFIARLLISVDDLGEQPFFLNRNDPQTLSNVEPLYNTGVSGSFHITMNRAKWGLSFQGRDENNSPSGVMTLSEQVIVVATKAGYVSAWDTVSVAQGGTAQITLIMNPE